MTGCPHSPGAVVDVDADEQQATCTRCSRRIVRLRDDDEDRAGRWSSWRLPPRVVVVDAPIRRVA